MNLQSNVLRWCEQGCDSIQVEIENFGHVLMRGHTKLPFGIELVLSTFADGDFLDRGKQSNEHIHCNCASTCFERVVHEHERVVSEHEHVVSAHAFLSTCWHVVVLRNMCFETLLFVLRWLRTARTGRAGWDN